MTLEIGLTLGIVALAVILFSFEHLPTDVIALLLVLILVLTGLLSPAQAFAGFGSETVVMIFGLLVLTAALVRTGMVETAGKWLQRFTGKTTTRAMAVIMGVATTLSAFMSNTATTAFLAPIVLGLARRLRISPAKLLMPLAFASILASSLTLVGTSTNIVVSGLMTQYGLPPLRMFELTPVGLPLALMGIAYMLLIGQHLIPVRKGDSDDDDTFGIRPYLAEIMLLPESPLIGKTLTEAALGQDMDLAVLRVVRERNRYLAPQANLRLMAGDELLVEGPRDQLLKIRNVNGMGFKSDIKLSDPRLQSETMQLAEVLLLPGSPLIGRTLKTLRFRQRYGIQVLGVNRRGHAIFRKLSQVRLQVGDQLLVQGPRANLATMDEDNTFHLVGAVEHKSPNQQRAPIAIGAFALVLVLAALEIVPLAVAAIMGVLLVFITRTITPEEAYRTLEWKAIIVIGSMLALGVAMQHSGAADFLAGQLVTWMPNADPRWLLTAFFALTMLLTQPMSNQAAAAVVLPVALETALLLGLNPRTFAVMIAAGASCSFITPLEPACLIVYGPGRYRFFDFVKIGTPLTIVFYLIALVLVPVIWPL